ncbi:MAG: glucose-6-phosphate isomerase [Alphaproteobacteria bacterium]
MSYRHLTEACFAARIGDGGLSGDAFAKTLADAAPALEGLRARHADGTLPILRLPALRDDLDALADVAKRLSERFDDVVVLGTGGSSLGGQALAALADAGYSRPRGTPRLHFIDNIDPHSIARLLAGLDLASSGFVAVSKSGATAETLAQCLVALDALRSAVGEAALAKHVTLITGPGASPLRRLGERYGLETLDHDPGVGGRFSVLSLVGLLPAMIAGLDAEAVRAGAARVLDATLAARQPRDSEPAVGAAIAVGLLREHGIATTVMMPYVDRLAPFALWYRQLWAESLGKNGAGTTPVHARGAVDQHSQLQFYLAGPRDKMFTLLTLDVAGAGARVPADLADDDALAYLRGRTIGDLMDAGQRATADALARQGRPVRTFELARLDERTLGALLMHFMLETIIAAHLFGVNPFDQPAVDEGKALARAYLAGEAAPREEQP